MERITLRTIAKWTNGIVNTDSDIYIKSAVIDSRDATKKSLFFCIRGSKTDGHNYVEEVRRKGGYSIGEEKFCDIVVNSTVRALGDIAGEYRKTVNPVVIGVTGSNGKTTVTRMIESILKDEFNLISTPYSFNNNIGLPVTVLSMDKETRIAVLEMGANHAGEIKYLSDIAVPGIGVITNVGQAHIGYFGNEENILRTKFEIAESLSCGSPLVYNYDQDEVKDAANSYRNNLNLIGFGLNKGADVRCEIINTDSKSSIFEVDGYRFKINIPGTFNIYNSIAAIATAKIFNISFEKIWVRLKEFKALSHRMQKIRINGVDILDDCYNANPTSVRKLFEELLKIYPQKDIIAVIGEMLELGEYSGELHKSIGEFIAHQENVKYFLAGGSFSDSLIDGAKKGNIDIKNLYKFKNSEEAAQIIKDISNSNSIVVLKASRLENLEDVIEYLKSVKGKD